MADSVIIKIDGDDSGFRKALDGVGKATKAGMADVKAGIDLATAAMQKLANVAQKGIAYNATIEQMQTSFEVMTGSAEKAAEVVERLRLMGAETPFETTDLVNTTQLLMQYGFTADDAIDKMRMLGDIAQGNTEAMNSIALGYAQMSSAGKVNLQDIKQMINGGFNPLQEISERTGESMASLYDRISKGTMTVDEITQSMVNATSEGGKFFQSMEKQSQTLSGQLSTLKDNTDQLLGSLTEGFSEGLRDNLLPLANNMIGELQDAFSQRGTQGLIDTATEMIPRLLDMMTGGFEKGIDAVGKWLPKGAKALMKSVPGALRSAGDVVPQITTVLFEVSSVVLQDLAAMLPELVPVIAEGLWNTAKAVFDGVIDALNGLGEGLETAMKKIGLVAPEAGEAFAKLVESVDQQTIDELKKTIDVDIETDLTVEGYQEKIDSAVGDIETALKNIPELSEQEKATIKDAIINGSGMDVLQIAFDEMGVDSTAATTAISTAQSEINAVVEGLGLSATAKEHIQSLIENNAAAGEIQSAIESYGIEEGAAATATAQITAEMDELDTTLSGLGLDPLTITKLRLGLFTDKAKVQSALQLLGLDETSIETVLASYDTVAGSITAGIDGIYKNIAEMFTDGIPESDADVAKAKEKIEGIAQEAQERVDKWYADKVKELNESGLEGDTLEKELLNAKATYDSLTESIQSSTDTALTQTESMVGKSTAYCKEQVKLLGETFDVIKDITAEIDLLTSEDISEASTSRKLTIAGVTNDAGTQLEAFLITYKEYTDKVREAEEAYLAATEQARKDYEAGGSQADYENAEQQAREQLNDAKKHAADYYQQYIDQILAGIIMADPQTGGALQQAVSLRSMAKLAQDLNAALVTAFSTNQSGETTLTLADILGQFNLDETGVGNLAEALGLTPDRLMQQMEAQLKVGDSTLGGTTSSFVTGINAMIADTLKGDEVDLSNAATVLATAIDSGYLLPAINGVDYSNAAEIWNTTLQNALNVTETVLSEAETAGSDLTEKVSSGASGSGDAGGDKGSDFGEGYVNGIKKWASAAYSGAYALAKSAAAGAAEGQDSHSPSKIARGLGNDFGAGYSIGIRESMARAALTAKQMAGEIVTAADISRSMRVNMPNIQQEIIAANEQSATPVYLDGHQIAEIQGHNNSTAIAWRNTQAAKGVGGR